MGLKQFMVHKIKNIDYQKMNKILDIISLENDKSKPFIIFDLILNFITRGVGYTDYFRGNYINLTDEEKDTFVTTKSFYKIHEYLNDKRYLCVLNDKAIFNRYFNEYLKRDYINLRECTKKEFNAFIKKHKVIFAKVPVGFGGHGVSKIIVKEYQGDLYEDLIKKGQYILEEAIIQHESVNKINPNVVNSFRVITLYKDGKAYVLNNALRVNQDDNDIIGCTNDLYFSLNEKGKIDSNVIDDFGNIYKEHPLTETKFKDVTIPFVKEAFEMCKEAALKIPQVRYIGWDIAFSENGPVIMEGNEYPGYGLVQFYKLHNKRTGHLKEIKDILKDEMEKVKY